MRQACPWSASREGDGESFQGVLLYNLFQAGTEVDELTHRSIDFGFKVIPDSGGPGRHRGGAALMVDQLWRVAASQMPYAFKTRQWRSGGGIYGGGPGLLGGLWIWDDPLGSGIDVRALPAALDGELYGKARPCFGVMDPDTHELDPAGVYVFLTGATDTPAGALTRAVSPGGGGWGDPLEREPDLVLRDVRDEYVSVDGAARDYGVVVRGDPARDPEGLVIDEEATARLRAERRGTSEGVPEEATVHPATIEQRCHPTASVEKTAVAGRCPDCGAEDLKAYPVLRDGGWFQVLKCQSCLATVKKDPWNRLGSVKLDGEDFLW